MMFRLLPLLVLSLGVVTGRRHGHHDDANPSRPIIITEEQQRRICADLCQSGLGGEPCGEVCFDLMPRGIPVQFVDDNTTATGHVDVDADADADTNTIGRSRSRNAVCPVLCENRLGYPLCQCPSAALPAIPSASKFRVDFNRICEHYCDKQSWVLRGCPACTNLAAKQDGLLPLFKQDGRTSQEVNKLVNMPGTTFQATDGKVDWGKWCNEQCANANGGSACNCDILPFSL